MDIDDTLRRNLDDSEPYIYGKQIGRAPAPERSVTNNIFADKEKSSCVEKIKVLGSFEVVYTGLVQLCLVGSLMLRLEMSFLFKNG
ncbi:hypothetical protein RIF29_33987 [Crotalaria pallida]|uniref:Uncharacterized protein n=1 Tax=Crotalaria pallida TaxID=3830 RepID=A0AAN9EEB7_CROPI